MNTRSPMPALAMAAIAMPASRKIAIEVRPERLAMRVEDRSSSTSEPAKAASGSNWFCMKRRLWPIWLSVNTIAAAAANAPPEDTPTSAGSASGLRNSPCMMAPDAASRAPTIAAAAMRGIRIDHSTSWSRASVGSARRLPTARARPAAAPAECRRRPPSVRPAPRRQARRAGRRGSGKPAGANAYPLRRLRTFRAVGQGGHSRQFAVSAAGVNFSACGASAG